MIARLIFVVAILLVLIGGFLLWVELDMFFAVDSCLDQGGSFNYSVAQCDFSQSHPYMPRQSQMFLGTFCLLMGVSGIVWSRRKRVPR